MSAVPTVSTRKSFMAEMASISRTLTHDQKRLTGLLFVLGLGVGYVLSAGPTQAIDWTRQLIAKNEANALEPTMRALAATGHADAILWLAQRYPKDDALASRLEIIATTGNAQAMFLLARHVWATDQERAKGLVARAAGEGYAPAMQTEKLLASH